MVRVYLSFIVNTLFKRCNLTLIKRLIVRLALRILICYCRREKLHTDLKLKINLTFSMVLWELHLTMYPLYTCILNFIKQFTMLIYH